MKVTIIIPVYNEFQTFERVLERVRQASLPPGCCKEIVVVDDGSTDGTAQILRKQAQSGVVIAHHATRNFGKGAAIRTGIAQSSGDIILIQDGDLEYDPADYERILQPIVTGAADVVYGSRFLGRPAGMALKNRVANWILTSAANLLYSAGITDEATAYKAFRAPLLRGLRLECQRFEFCPEVTAKLRRLGYRITEVPIRYNARGMADGKKIRARDGFEALWTLVRYRFAPAAAFGAEDWKAPRHRAPARLSLRTSEWILGIYLLYTSSLAFAFALSPRARAAVLTGNACVFLAYAALLRVHYQWRGYWSGIVRDWAPLAVMIVCYKQMGWFAQPQHTHALERAWVIWDRFILYRWGVKPAIESLGAIVPAVLELSYLLVYALPVFVIAALYVYRRRERVDEFLTIYLLALCLAYGQFPFWPSEPPRTLFAGQDLPAVTTFFRRMVLLMLGSQGIHTSVFPSAHASGAFAAAFVVWRIFKDKAPMRWGVLIYAVLVAIAIVYGRYHYAADAVAGLAMAIVAYVWGRRWEIRRTTAC